MKIARNMVVLLAIKIITLNINSISTFIKRD